MLFLQIVHTFRVPRYHNQSDENIGVESVIVNTKLVFIIFVCNYKLYFKFVKTKFVLFVNTNFV